MQYPAANQYAPPPPAGISPADASNLDLLAVLHWVYGGIMGVAGLGVLAAGIIPAIAIGATVPASKGGPPPWFAAGIFLFIFGFLALFFLVKSVVTILAGSALRARRRYMLVMVASVLSVMNIPLGTALAVFTFVTLNKPEVKAAFEANA